MNTAAAQETTEAARARLRLEAAERFKAFLAEPSRRAYSEFYVYLVRHPLFDPLSANFDAAEDLYLQKKYQSAIEIIEGSWPNYLLTPQAFFLLTACYRGLEETEKAKSNSHIGQVVRTAIRESGEGTKERPFYISRPKAEIDLFDALGTKSKSQRRVRIEDRSFDVHTTESGKEYWVEVTFVLQRLKKDE